VSLGPCDIDYLDKPGRIWVGNVEEESEWLVVGDNPANQHPQGIALLRVLREL
jgi:hypothetical protein